MKKVKIIAVDDEPLALALVADYIRKTCYLELKGAFDNPLDAMDFLGDNPVDLIVLDIQMPDLSGIDFIKTTLHPPMVIFTTAYEKYAIEGFKVNAVDYLLKPFSYQEFLAAIQKARHFIELEYAAMPRIEFDSQFLFLKSEYKIRKINFNDILYIEGMKDYIKIYLQGEAKPVLSINTIKSIEQKLPPEQFMRIHRSFVINLLKITTIERGRIIFADKHIPVSQPYEEKFQGFLKQNFL